LALARYALAMNYRHAYHAGNHADVLKHSVLAHIVEYLGQKDKAFAVLDAHAGIGLYDLSSVEAGKTGEWMGGVGKIAEPFDDGIEVILKAYRTSIGRMNATGTMQYYPGSPEIVLHHLRESDRLLANELHPQDAQTLRQSYVGDDRLQVLEMDALQAIKASLPFKERRGLVLIDPPYEQVDETQRVARMLAEGQRRFATGIFMIWYPVTTHQFVDGFLDAIEKLALGNILRAELCVKKTEDSGGLSGSGLLILNPPFTLESELRVLLPALAERLGVDGHGRSLVEWLTPAR
jgi:23S rRNA (adenine2030-N6)-methyltransferase